MVEIVVELIVTPEMREAHARKNRKPLIGEPVYRETAEHDLGEIEC